MILVTTSLEGLRHRIVAQKRMETEKLAFAFVHFLGPNCWTVLLTYRTSTFFFSNLLLVTTCFLCVHCIRRMKTSMSSQRISPLIFPPWLCGSHCLAKRIAYSAYSRWPVYPECPLCQVPLGCCKCSRDLDAAR